MKKFLYFMYRLLILFGSMAAVACDDDHLDSYSDSSILISKASLVENYGREFGDRFCACQTTDCQLKVTTELDQLIIHHPTIAPFSNTQDHAEFLEKTKSCQGNTAQANFNTGTALPKAKIIAGSVVPENAPNPYPWYTALIAIKKNGVPAVGCGATLIHPQWVLTAAHCIKYVKTAYVDVGRRSLYTPPEELQRRMVAKAFPHKRFDVDNPQNGHDIGLIKLDKPVNDVPPIRIASAQENASLNVGQPMVAVGMGATWFRFFPSSKLKHISVAHMPSSVCKKLFILTRFATNNKLSDTVLCTVGSIFAIFGGGVSAGDSGGPLVSKHSSGEWVQYGVTSYGEPSAPLNAWSRTSCFHDWINTIIKSDGENVPESQVTCTGSSSLQPSQNAPTVPSEPEVMGKNPSDIMKKPY